MIDLEVNQRQLDKTIKRAKEKNIIIPTFEQMKNPNLIPEVIKKRLQKIDLWDIHPLNLFRISWKNEPKKKNGLFGEVNFIEIPSDITGVEARVFGLVGKWFPTGAHKVGATFGCLVPKLVTGQFDPTYQKAVWPSTGNYCRGGAYNAELLSCESIAILPEGMSRERFDWLSKVAGEVIATPGTESNVKEIFDKSKELIQNRDNVVIFNQFEELGNYLWHYEITGHAIEESLNSIMKKGDRYAGIVLTTGSAGTLGCGDYLKNIYPRSKVVAGEALQCPTLLFNGFGAHRLEGIGDKHVPWIHNVKNTDMVIAVDDKDVMNTVRLFNEQAGQEYLNKKGVPESFIELLPLLGISSIANLIMTIKFAKYYELTKRDIIFTVFTDSMELYSSRLKELQEELGEYTLEKAAIDDHVHLKSLSIDYMKELSYYERKNIHHLKYFTWVEQQGKNSEELNAQWYDDRYWENIREQSCDIDRLIKSFNKKTGLLTD